MNLELVEKQALDNYVSNMNFLKTHSPALHNKMRVFEDGINEGIIPSKYSLEYRDGEYFDLYDLENNCWVYGQNSLDYSKDITKNIDLDVTKNSFKTFYEYHYEEGVLDKVKNASMLSSAIFGNAPIVDYVNNNLPKEMIYKQIFCYMIFGIGLGFHIPLIHKEINAKLYLIIEPNIEIFRLSLFTISYEELSKRSQLIFFIGYDKETFALRFRDFHSKAYLYNQYIKFFFFSKSCEFYFEAIQSMLSSQSHTLFSYDRQLHSLKLTAEYSQNHYNFMKVNKRFGFKLANNAPILVLAGGPSFKKNIDFIKENQNKFIIVTIFGLLNILEENDIHPDIITNYEAVPRLYLEIYSKLKDPQNYFNDKILMFGSHVSEEVVNLLPKDNLYFFNALFSVKKDLGNITGPSIGEMTYALSLIFAPDEVYLLGLDLAFDPETGKSHFEGYNEKSQFSVDRDASLEKFSFRKNVMKIKGNLRDFVETTAVFDISIKQLNAFTNIYNPDRKIKVYNLSDGAYFVDVEPKDIKDIDFSKYNEIDKTSFVSEIKNCLATVSSNEFSTEDLEFIKNKIEDAKKLKINVDNLLLANKHSSIEKYLVCIESLDKEFEKKEYACDDLNTTILNYCRYNLPYIFFILNLKNIDNPKAHIKKMNKNLHTQLSKIINTYIKILDK